LQTSNKEGTQTKKDILNSSQAGWIRVSKISKPSSWRLTTEYKKLSNKPKPEAEATRAHLNLTGLIGNERSYKKRKERSNLSNQDYGTSQEIKMSTKKGRSQPERLQYQGLNNETRALAASYKT